MSRHEWVLSQRLGPKLRIKRWSDLAQGETFQESRSLGGVLGIMDALALHESIAHEIYDSLSGTRHKGHHARRLDDSQWKVLRRAFEQGECVIVPLQTAPVGIAWGAKVSAAFRQKVIAICARLGTKPDFLMSCMAFESSETFSPSIRNAAGSGAVGLIQFMPQTAANLHTSVQLLAAMTPEDQLDYVEKYFDNPHFRDKLGTIEDLYMAILWPAAVGKEMSYVLFRSPSITYTQNAGLDLDKDGVVTKYEAASCVRAKLAKGAHHAG